MKKLLPILLIAIGSLSASVAHSQITMTCLSELSVSRTSTHTDADTTNHRVDLNGQTNNFNHILVVLAGVKLGGTVAGSAVLQGSVDNSNWFTVTDSTGTGSQSLSNGNNNLQWRVPGTIYRYYRVRVITSGTQSSSYTCRLLGRKVPN